MSGPGGTDKPVFDPRHDARFQRGYRAGDPPVPVSAPDAASGATVSDPSAGIGDALAYDTDIFHDVPEQSRWNPYIGLLWLIGVALMGGALALQWQAAANMFSNASYSGTGPVPVEMLLQQLSYMASPSMLAAGLVTVTGLLFWHAFTWRARRRPAVRA